MAADEVELGWLCGVVALHTPAFFLHPHDRFMPCSAEFFLQHSELRLEEDISSAVLLPRGTASATALLEAQQRAAGSGGRLRLDLDPAARCGEPLVRRFC
jgi:hypothetical protein